MSSQRTVVIGIILLIIGLVLYGYFSCINVPYKDVPDDMVSWFHLHVVDYLKSGGDPRNDTHLRLIDGRNLYLSPIFIDMLILALNVSPWYVVLSMGILYVLLVFVSTYFISKNWVVAGLASVLFSTAPAFVYCISCCLSLNFFSFVDYVVGSMDFNGFIFDLFVGFVL